MLIENLRRTAGQPEDAPEPTLFDSLDSFDSFDSFDGLEGWQTVEQVMSEREGG